MDINLNSIINYLEPVSYWDQTFIIIAIVVVIIIIIAFSTFLILLIILISAFSPLFQGELPRFLVVIYGLVLFLRLVHSLRWQLIRAFFMPMSFLFIRYQ